MQVFINSQFWLFQNRQAEKEATQGEKTDSRPWLGWLAAPSPCMVLGKGQKSSPSHRDELLHLRLECCKCFCWLDRERPDVVAVNVGCMHHWFIQLDVISPIQNKQIPAGFVYCSSCGCWHFSKGLRREQHSTIASAEHPKSFVIGVPYSHVGAEICVPFTCMSWVYSIHFPPHF